MNRYQPTTHRAAFGLFATAMTAFTIALAVVVPANMDVTAQQERLLALSGHAPVIVHVATPYANERG